MKLTEIRNHCGLPEPRIGHISDWRQGGITHGVHVHDGPAIDVYAERINRLFRRKAAK